MRFDSALVLAIDTSPLRNHDLQEPQRPSVHIWGAYINYPGYGKPGHHTVGALYTTFLQSVGVKQKSFGRIDPDLDLATMQTGPLTKLMV